MLVKTNEDEEGDNSHINTKPTLSTEFKPV